MKDGSVKENAEANMENLHLVPDIGVILTSIKEAPRGLAIFRHPLQPG
jgi:hypothetical protein